jgi:hypothetical protein
MASLAFLLRGAESKPDWVVSLLDKSAASVAAAAVVGGHDANQLNANVGGWETGTVSRKMFQLGVNYCSGFGRYILFQCRSSLLQHIAPALTSCKIVSAHFAASRSFW